MSSFNEKSTAEQNALLKRLAREALDARLVRAIRSSGNKFLAAALGKTLGARVAVARVDSPQDIGVRLAMDAPEEAR